jgi:short-subunit dehydrogenase
MPDNTNRTTALVTGASAGIGQAYAERLARDGRDVIVVARRRDRLEELAQRLKHDHAVDVTVLAADLTQPDDLHTVERAIADHPTLDLVVNSAGFGGYRPFVELPPDEAEELVRLHIVALTRLTRAALPGMISRQRGAIVNIASLLAFSASVPAPPLPFRAVYAGAKSYIVTFSEIVAAEVKASGVQVQALCPGIVATEFHDVRGLKSDGLPHGMSPENVVEGSLAGLRLGDVICVPQLEDRAVITHLEESRTALLRMAGMTEVAERYKQPS